MPFFFEKIPVLGVTFSKTTLVGGDKSKLTRHKGLHLKNDQDSEVI